MNIISSMLKFLAENTMPTGAGAHNAHYRGKYLGTSVTAEQWAEIAAGTFRDLYIGDYWTIGGVNYRIAHFDYWLHMGDTECTKHHVVIVPDGNLYNEQMNSSNTTSGAYVGSAMRSSGLNSAKSTINSAFGSSHVLSKRLHLQNAISNNIASGGTWYDSTVDLMSEIEVYGCRIWDNVANGTSYPNLYTVGHSQFALFRHDHSRICNRAHWWLRSVYSETHFCAVSSDGNANYGTASTSLGVRPAFGICA